MSPGILLLIMVLILLVWMISDKAASATPVKVEPCKLHSWCWDEVKEQRWCMTCNHVVKLEQYD